MAKRRNTSELRGQAISLFLSGMSLADIAAALSVSLRTLTRWRQGDAAAGASWDEQRSKSATWSPEALLARIRELIGQVLSDRSRAPEQVADIVAKLTATEGRLAEGIGNIGKILDSLKVFSDWAAGHLSDERRAQIIQDFEAFMDHLRDKAEGTEA